MNDARMEGHRTDVPRVLTPEQDAELERRTGLGFQALLGVASGDRHEAFGDLVSELEAFIEDCREVNGAA